MLSGYHLSQAITVSIWNGESGARGEPVQVCPTRSPWDPCSLGQRVMQPHKIVLGFNVYVYNKLYILYAKSLDMPAVQEGQ